MWGIQMVNSPEKCPVSDMACQSVVGCVVTGTLKTFSNAHSAGHAHMPPVKPVPAQGRVFCTSSTDKTTDSRYTKYSSTSLSPCYTPTGSEKHAKCTLRFSHFTVTVFLWLCFLFHVESSLYSCVLFMQLVSVETHVSFPITPLQVLVPPI